MPINIGTSNVSDEQLSHLRSVLRDVPTHRLLKAFFSVIRDPGILSGEEQLHPDWFEQWEKHRERINIIAPDEMVSEMDSFLATAPECDSEVRLIDPIKAKICFLLGAGASSPSGIPTVRELLPDLLTRAKRLDREEVTKLADFCEESGIDNIEDLLTAAQISEFCGRNPTILKLFEFLLFREGVSDRDSRRPRRASVDVSSIAFMQDTLQVLFGLLSSLMLPAEPNDGHKAIAGFVGRRNNSQIVTTNYDCCMDRALTEQDVPYTYYVDFANSRHVPTTDTNPIGLVKLHGSLNWFYCETCQEVHWIDIQKTVEDYLDDRALYPVIAVCRTCGGQRRGLLVPPLAMKFDVAPPLNPIIGKASAAFSDVDIIVVVGFSFAEADLYISRMVSKAVQANERTQIVVFDPDANVIHKMRSKFSARIPDFDSSRILWVRGDCSESLPKFLNGDFKETEAVQESLEPTEESQRQS